MKQEINLFKHLPHAPTVWLTKEKIILFYAGFFLILLLNLAQSLWTRHQAVKQFDVQNQLLVQQKNYLNDLLKKYPVFNPKDLEASVQQLQQQLNIQLKLSRMVNQGKLFSDYLKAFGETILPGMWLTEMIISNPDQNIMMKGYSIQPVIIQKFLDNLSKQPVFQGVLLGVQELSQTTPADKNVYGYLNFVATSKMTAAP